LSLEEMSALGKKYGNDTEKMLEDTKIPSDWCLSIDPCPKGLECCNNNDNSSSQSFFDKNKKLIIIGLVALIIVGGIIYMFKRKNVDVTPVSRKRRSRK
jgi:LPXTG-motif cell wall-anchored protein